MPALERSTSWGEGTHRGQNRAEASPTADAIPHLPGGAEHVDEDLQALPGRTMTARCGATCTPT
eukprot:3874359-Prymnesium_polylepis.2